MIHILYRLLVGENKKGRPEWYSKKACFHSVYQAMTGGMTLKVYLNKGPCGWLHDDVIVENIDTRDMAETCLLVYHEAVKFPSTDWVYFCEDDYMHLPDSFAKLQHCIEDVKPDLISLYDHPDRYINLPEHNLTNGKNDIFVSRDHHWRTIPSTGMTFAASVKCLKENQDLLEEWTYIDFELFPRILGLRGGERLNKYLMVGAIPGLATHCEDGYLSPIVDWNKYGNRR